MDEARKAKQERNRKFMNDQRELARARKHVCPPNALDAAMHKLLAQLDKYAQGNTAPIPITMSYEEDEWCVMIHVRIPRVTEYEVEAYDKSSLADAVSNAARALGAQTELRNGANRDAKTYRYTF